MTSPLSFGAGPAGQNILAADVRAVSHRMPAAATGLHWRTAMVERRDVLRLGLAGLALSVPVLSGCGRSPTGGHTLRFDSEAFEELTDTIATAGGDRAVTYRFYRAIPYVAKPVDVACQSLNISVPVAIDAVPVDASRAPILFANSVGGYMPSSTAKATGVGAGGMTGMTGMPGMGGMPGDPPPDAMAQVGSGGNAMISRAGRMVSNARLALAAGYVVVEPGARGRTLRNDEGVYYGVAPAAIVDLKAAVRYLRANRRNVPGNMDRIVSSGTSAGGALSALLGASADDALYDDALAAVGAADASDAVFAAAAWCPITDLGHADMAYEWNWGENPLATGGLVNPLESAQLAGAFAGYQASLGLHGEGVGALTAETLGPYLVESYLQPAADRYLASLPAAERATYLSTHSFIRYVDRRSGFSWADFRAHVGARRKSLPAFDAFDLSAPENNLFGLGKTKARHFTTYSLRKASGDPTAVLDADLPRTLEQMNPMPFLLEGNRARAKHWWLRVGTRDTDTSLSVLANLAAVAAARGDDVDAAMYWDAGHGANEDADAFIAWIDRIAGD